MEKKRGLNSERIGLKLEINKDLRLINTNLIDRQIRLGGLKPTQPPFGSTSGCVATFILKMFCNKNWSKLRKMSSERNVFLYNLRLLKKENTIVKKGKKYNR